MNPCIQSHRGEMDGTAFLLRTHANGDLTICTRPAGSGESWAPEVELIAEPVEVTA